MSAGIYDGHLWTEGKLENTCFNKKIVSNIKSNTELYEKKKYKQWYEQDSKSLSHMPKLERQVNQKSRKSVKMWA